MENEKAFSDTKLFPEKAPCMVLATVEGEA